MEIANDKESVKAEIKQTNDRGESDGSIFKDVIVFVIPSSLGKLRLNLFQSQIVQHGGTILDRWTPDGENSHVRFLVAEENLTVEHLEKVVGQEHVTRSVDPPYVVKTSWISECLRQKRRVDFRPFLFVPNESSCSKSDDSVSHAWQHRSVKRHASDEEEDDDSDYVLSGDDISTDTQTAEQPFTQKNTFIKTDKFACATSSTSRPINYNKHITDKLEALAATYTATQDRWRALGYERAISVLRNHPKEITSWEEARSLPKIGDRLADKIWEIVESGHLRKMEFVCSSERVATIQLFSNVWGIGPTTAQLLVQQGYRTLDDLQNAKLNRQQVIGLRHYNDFLDRMPREEAQEIEETVRQAALAIEPGLEALACGSYRRGKATCGDVDVLVTHPDGKSHRGRLARLVAALRQTGFLTDDLVSSEDKGNQQKYMGVCRLPKPDAKHRRLDIIVVPFCEFACAILYFTGSAHFNRSMRLLARRMGMSLSEHSLNRRVVRKGQVRLHEGIPIPTPTEESIFEQLGIPYREPKERDH